MVFPGRFSSGCLRCRQRKVKVSNAFVLIERYLFCSNLLSLRSATRGSRRVDDATTTGSHALDIPTSFILGTLRQRGDRKVLLPAPRARQRRQV